jgi:predicted component of type VI protein secretion system
MTCPSCGVQNPADFLFCLQCGNALTQGSPGIDQGGATRADLMPVEAGTMAMSAPPSMLGGTGGTGGGARLRVEEGSIDEEVIGLDRPLTQIGRRKENDVVSHDTNVSREHAQIRHEDGRYIIEDKNSSNGTIVNDARIEQPYELRPGDVIRIGDAVFVFETEQPDLLETQEGSTMAFDLDSPMTSLGGAPELVPPSLGMHPAGPLTPPPAIMDPSQTAIADGPIFDDEPVPVRPVTPLPSSPRPNVTSAPPPRPAPVAGSTPAPSAGAAASGSTAAALDALRRELGDVGQELGSFSGTLGGLADRVERLERALDAATGDLASIADAIRGPDAAVLKELQGILADVERVNEGPSLDDALGVLEQLSNQPRDIELLLKLSQQASAIETALRIHGRLVAAAPQLRTTLARLTG